MNKDKYNIYLEVDDIFEKCIIIDASIRFIIIYMKWLTIEENKDKVVMNIYNEDEEIIANIKSEVYKRDNNYNPIDYKLELNILPKDNKYDDETFVTSNESKDYIDFCYHDLRTKTEISLEKCKNIGLSNIDLSKDLFDHSNIRSVLFEYLDLSIFSEIIEIFKIDEDIELETNTLKISKYNNDISSLFSNYINEFFNGLYFNYKKGE